MKHIWTQLLADESGFVISAELVLVATISVLGLVVGLSEVAHNVSQELEDVGSAFSCVDQSFHFRLSRGHMACMNESCFRDEEDFCSGQCDITGNGIRGEK